MCDDLKHGPHIAADLPWILRTNKLMHVRPVRLLDIC
jgi:hypothetical protein